MSGSSRYTLAAAVLAALLGPATVATAEPIGITSGTLDVGGIGGTLTLTGDRGFTFAGGVAVPLGVFGPALCRPCAAGSPVDLVAVWTGSDLLGDATFEGVTYQLRGGQVPNTPFGSVFFTGSAGVAPPVDVQTATLAGDFGFQGVFFFPGLGFQDAFGGGTATVVLNRTPGDVWSFSRAVYQFQPVPEPASVVLVTTGLAGLIAGCRRRRTGQQD